MAKYKFLQHTADAKFLAFGKTLEEAFANAALAMFSVMFEPEKIKGRVSKKITVAADNKETLLYKFLEELLFLLDSQSFFLHKVKSISIKDGRLDAVAVGDTELSKYKIHGEVKAVTYNEMLIKEQKGKAVVQVVVDL